MLQALCWAPSSLPGQTELQTKASLSPPEGALLQETVTIYFHLGADAGFLLRLYGDQVPVFKEHQLGSYLDGVGGRRPWA